MAKNDLPEEESDELGEWPDLSGDEMDFEDDTDAAPMKAMKGTVKSKAGGPLYGRVMKPTSKAKAVATKKKDEADKVPKQSKAPKKSIAPPADEPLATTSTHTGAAKGAGEQRDVATKDLNVLLQKFQKDYKGKPPDFAELKNRLTDKQLIAVWMRLKTARNGCKDMSIAEAWETLHALKVGGTKLKQHVLCEFVMDNCDPNGVHWRQRLINVKESAQEKETKKEAHIPKTKGQLIKEHGLDEATDFIRRGKYKSFVDKDGDAMYVRVEQSFTKEGSKKKEIEIARHMWNEHQRALKADTIKS